jgi:hypothetical protein
MMRAEKNSCVNGHRPVAARAYYSLVSSRERARKRLDAEPGTDWLLRTYSFGNLHAGRVVTSFRVDAQGWKPLGGP